MKKKLLTVALAATMVLSSALSAFAAETKIDQTTLAADTCTEQANPLQGKNAEKVTITYTINWNADAPKNGWDGVFSFFDATTGGRVSFQTAPYICFNAGADEKWIDAKADAWCSTNCEAGKDYTFQYVITKDAITVSCDGTAIAEFAEVGRGTGAAASGYQDVLDALNTYPTLTIGCGMATSCYWNTEPCTISITIDDGIAAAAPEGDAPAADGEDTTTAAGGENTTTAAGSTAGTTTTPNTGDATMVGLLLAVAAVSAVVVLKKRTVAE